MTKVFSPAGETGFSPPETVSHDPDEADDADDIMDDAKWHLSCIREKNLPADPLSAFSHLAAYLRWCMSRNLMDPGFSERHAGRLSRLLSSPSPLPFREFVRDELGGKLRRSFFNEEGRAFSLYYYNNPDQPYFPSDIDNYALDYFGPDRYHSDEFRQEAYLFIPFGEAYRRRMDETITRRWNAWQRLGRPGDLHDRYELFCRINRADARLAEALADCLGCDCLPLPPLRDEDPIAALYSYARRLGPREGFIPLLAVPDEILLETLLMNMDEESEGEADLFAHEKAALFRASVLSAPIRDGRAVLAERSRKFLSLPSVFPQEDGAAGMRAAGPDRTPGGALDVAPVTGQGNGPAPAPDETDEASDYASDGTTGHRPDEALSEAPARKPEVRFSGYWNAAARRTFPLLLLSVPVKNPWEVFAYVPFGGWDDCPSAEDLTAVSRHWFEQYGAVPAVVSRDMLEFTLPHPPSPGRIPELVREHLAFCPSLLNHGPPERIAADLAETVAVSDHWLFRWD